MPGPMTVIASTLLDATDQPSSGRVRVTLVGPGFVDGDQVISKVRVNVGDDGLWSVDLIPNADYDVANTYYEVLQIASDSSKDERAIVVPAGGPFSLFDVLTDIPGDLEPAEVASIRADLAEHAASPHAGAHPDTATHVLAGLASAQSVADEATARAAADAAEATARAAGDAAEATARESAIAALSGNYVSTVAAPTGVKATDTAAIQAAHDALPAGGGMIVLRAGTYAVTGVTFTKPVTLVGMGGSLVGDGGMTTIRAVTTIICDSATADALTFTGIGVTLRDFAVVNTAASTPTAGTGIKLSAASQAHITGVSIVGFWNCLETSGNYFMFTGCHVYDPVNYGIFLNNVGAIYLDHADMVIANCVISGLYKTWNGAAGIRWESGGGVRITGCKINGGSMPGNASAGKFGYAIDIAAADGVATGDFQITGNSIANFTIAGIRITLKGPTYVGASLVDMGITGNQINVSAAGVGIDIATPLAVNNNQIRNVLISDNVFAFLGGSSMRLNNAKNVHVGVNVHDSVGSPVIRLGSGSYAGGLVNCSVETQNVRADAIDLLQDWRALNDSDRGHDGVIQHRYRRACRLSVAGTWVTMFTFTPWALGSAGSAGQFSCRVSGHNGATGPFTGRYERLWAVTNNASSPTLTTVGTDVTAGAGVFEVQFVLSTNKVTVQVRLAAGASVLDFQGLVELDLSGPLNTIHKGA